MGAAAFSRPAWVPDALYPFEDRFVDAGGARIHYVDEGSGPTLLMLHGNPTWSFLYRDVILGLRDSFRCIAPDLPGFGLSGAPAGYGFTAAEHADALERFVLELDLTGVTPLLQDWGGPTGCAVAVRHPDRFSRFVIGNTWAWPMTGLGPRVFSGFLGGPVGGLLIDRFNFFVERILPSGVRKAKLSDEVMDAYRGPFADRPSRRATHVFPREIMAAAPFLAEVERGLPRIADRPALIVWPTADVAFRARERERWEALFADHRTVTLEGAGHYMQEDSAGEIVAAIRAWSVG